MLRRLTTATLMAALIVPGVGSAADEPSSLEGLIDEIGRTMLSRFPEDVTDLGLSAELGLDDSGLNDLSAEYGAETASLAANALERLAAIDPDTLSGDEPVTHAVAEWYLRDIVSARRPRGRRGLRRPARGCRWAGRAGRRGCSPKRGCRQPADKAWTGHRRLAGRQQPGPRRAASAPRRSGRPAQRAGPGGRPAGSAGDNSESHHRNAAGACVRGAREHDPLSRRQE